MSNQLDQAFFRVPNDIFDLDIILTDKGKQRPLNAIEKLIYIYICRCGNITGEAYPSYTTIARKCGISRREAIYSINILEENTLIIKQIRRKSDKEHYSNIYTPSELVALGSEYPALGSEYPALGSANNAPGGELNTLGSAEVAPNKEILKEEILKEEPRKEEIQEEEKESARGKEEAEPLPRTYKEQYLKYEAMLKERGFSYTENTLKTINTAVNYYKLSDQQTKKMISLFTDENQLNFKNINTVAAEISKATSKREEVG